MNDNRFNDHTPTALEEQALAEAQQHFAGHLNQFPASRDAIRRLEENLSRTALAVNLTTSRTAPSRTRIQTHDGASWYKSVDLTDSVCACYRPTSAGTEFAVVERSPYCDAQDVVARGRNATEDLRTFAAKQRQALQLWTEDMTAQVNEFLTEKYPGKDMSRVAERFMHRFTRSVSHEQTLANAHKPHHGRRNRV